MGLNELSRCCALAAIGRCLLGVCSIDDNAPDGDAVFARARDVLAAQTCPARIDYAITVLAGHDHAVLSNRFHATYLLDKDYLHVRLISDEEARAPYVPRGTHISIALFGFQLVGLSRALTQQVNHDPPPTDFLGIPFLKPNYTFGLVRERIPASSSSDAPSTLRVIGSTSSKSRLYAVELLGIESAGGARAYHLKLRPLREPAKYRIRDMWVDIANYKVLQLATDGNFTSGPPTRVPWVTTFQDYAGCRLLNREIALAPLDFGRRGVYSQATFEFDIPGDAASAAMPVFALPRPRRDDLITEPGG